MSDSAKPAEIEDVLSSIRRLVAGGTAENPPVEEEDGTEPETAADDLSEALVLTPSLLVASEQTSDEEASSAQKAWEEDAAADVTNSEAGAEDDTDDELVPTTEQAMDGTEELLDVLAPEQALTVEEATEGDARDDAPPSVNFEHRRSPFLPDTMLAKRSAERTENREGTDAPRAGFGFGSARREDPVRHVPLSNLNQAEAPSANDREHRAQERTLNLSVPLDVDDKSSAESPATDTSATRTPVIAPGFAVPASSTTSDIGPDGVSKGAVEEDERLTLSGELSSPEAEPFEGSLDLRNSELTEQSKGENSNDSAPTSPTESRPSEEYTSEVSAEDASGASSDGPVVSVPEERDVEPEFLVEQMPRSEASSKEITASATASDTTQGDDAATSKAPQSLSARGSLNIFGRDPQGLDENTVTALITDVVHRELQGALGERVSRNIRLLIRREIARALEERDVD